jgi:hypothetical protein
MIRSISSLNDCLEKVSGYPKIKVLNRNFVYEALEEAFSEAFFFLPDFCQIS